MINQIVSGSPELAPSPKVREERNLLFEITVQ